ncbi:MAG: hypothetical protein WAO71_02585 [Gallionella sp.]
MKRITFAFCVALLSACSPSDSSVTAPVNRDAVPLTNFSAVPQSATVIASSPQNAGSLTEEDTGPEATPLTNNITWSGMGGVPGIQQVNSIVTSGNKVYVAGAITSNLSKGAGSASVAVWDGLSWNVLLEPEEDCHQVRSLAIDEKGNLYASGCINGVGLSSPSKTRKWNGKSWQLLGDGITGAVHSLEIDKEGNVYATGGNLQGMRPGEGYIYSGFVMKWDGKNWSKLGGGFLKGGYEHGAAISFDKRGYVYVVGSFESIRKSDLDESAGDIEAHNIAFWDGKKWNAMGTDVGGIRNNTQDMDEDTGAYSIAFDSKGTPYVTSSRGVEKWNGKKWEKVDIKTSAQVSSLLIDKNDSIYVGLYSTCNVEGGPSEGTEHPIQYWNGSKWGGFPFEGRNSGINPGCTNGGSVNLLAQDEAGNLVVGGAFTEATSGARNIAKWNGKKWGSFGRNVGVNDIVYGMAVDNAGALYVRGAFTRVDDIVVKKNQIAKWDEKNWSVLKATDDPIFNMKTDQNGSLYVATGHHTDQYNDGGISRISKWDGANWIQIAEINYLINSFIVDSQGKIYTCGYTGDESDHYGDTTLHGVDMWDGKVWTHLPEDAFKVAGYRCEFKLGKADELYASTGEDYWKWEGATWIKQNPLPSFDSFAEWKGNYFNITRENYNEGRNIIHATNKTTGQVIALGATSIGSIETMVASENFLYVGGSFLYFDGMASPFLSRFELKPQ